MANPALALSASQQFNAAFLAFTQTKDVNQFRKDIKKLVDDKVNILWEADFDPVKNSWITNVQKAESELGKPHQHQFVMDPPVVMKNIGSLKEEVLITSKLPSDMVQSAKNEAKRLPDRDYLKDGEQRTKVQKIFSFQETISDPEVRKFFKDAIRTPANVTANLTLIKSQSQPLYDKIINEIFGLTNGYIWTSEYFVNLFTSARARKYFTEERFKHHQATSGMRLGDSHYGEMQKLKPMATAQKTTEVRGEFATAAGILHFLSCKYQFKEGYSASGHHGADQVWVDRNRSTGEVKAYMIVEAKGSELAKLADTKNKGQQMSLYWVAISLAELYKLGNSRQQNLVTKIMESICGIRNYFSIKQAKATRDKTYALDHAVQKQTAVRGMVVQARPGDGVLHVTRLADFIV